MDDFTELELQMMELDERLQVIARRSVDIADPNWVAGLRKWQPPLDEAGVRVEAEGLLADLVAAYRGGGAAVRAEIRRMFVQCGSFAWAAGLAEAPTTEEIFRRQLVLFSMLDPGTDTRDALLVLQDWCRRAGAAGVGGRGRFCARSQSCRAR